MIVYPTPINVLLYIENMGGTPSCDSDHECPIRACNFSKHKPGDIDFDNYGPSTEDFKAGVRGHLRSIMYSYLGGSNTSTLATNLQKEIINTKSTIDMESAECIGFGYVYPSRTTMPTTETTETTETKQENFTNKRSPSLIGCVIAAILVIAAAILIWRLFVSRNAMRYQRSTLPDQSTAFPVDNQ